MKLLYKVIKPTSPGSRSLIQFDRKALYKGKPYKSLVLSIKNHGGRNNNGHMTVRHRGGGAKRAFRVIDFHRKRGGEMQIIRIEYDPNRTARIALTKSVDGVIKYILATEGLKPGD